MIRGAILLVAGLLSGCSGTTVQEAVQALASDKANACLVVHNAYPPFSQDFTYVHQGDVTQTAPTCK